MTPCALCAYYGRNSNLKSYHINFEETVQLCELPSCPYPLGTDGVDLSKKTKSKDGIYLSKNSQVDSNAINKNLNVINNVPKASTLADENVTIENISSLMTDFAVIENSNNLPVINSAKPKQIEKTKIDIIENIPLNQDDGKVLEIVNSIQKILHKNTHKKLVQVTDPKKLRNLRWLHLHKQKNTKINAPPHLNPKFIEIKSNVLIKNKIQVKDNPTNNNVKSVSLKKAPLLDLAPMTDFLQQNKECMNETKDSLNIVNTSKSVDNLCQSKSESPAFANTIVNTNNNDTELQNSLIDDILNSKNEEECDIQNLSNISDILNNLNQSYIESDLNIDLNDDFLESLLS